MSFSHQVRYVCTQLLVILPLAASQRLRITNGCAREPLWVAHMAGAEVGPDKQNLRLDPGKHHDFNTSDGLSATRYWPKMRCNSSGDLCLIGESGGPGQECNETMGCAPPIDSKFEGTFGTEDGIDWIDVSLVDGWTLPFEFKMVLKKGKKCNAGDGDRAVVTSVNCSGLTLDVCPGREMLGKLNTSLQVVHPASKQVVGCYSPCAKLTSNNWENSVADDVSPANDSAVDYCCPTPPMSPGKCRKGPVEDTNFVQAVHEHCPGVYGYSYDDGMGLITCPKDTHYEMIYYCPEDEQANLSSGRASSSKNESGPSSGSSRSSGAASSSQNGSSPSSRNESAARPARPHEAATAVAATEVTTTTTLPSLSRPVASEGSKTEVGAADAATTAIATTTAPVTATTAATLDCAVKNKHTHCLNDAVAAARRARDGDLRELLEDEEAMLRRRGSEGAQGGGQEGILVKDAVLGRRIESGSSRLPGAVAALGGLCAILAVAAAVGAWRRGRARRGEAAGGVRDGASSEYALVAIQSCEAGLPSL